MIRRFSIISLFLAYVSVLSAQEGLKLEPFKSLDISVTGGTTGIGVDVSTSVTRDIRVRAGFEVVPSFDQMMNFGVQVGDDPATSQSKFEKLSDMLTNFSGQKVNNSIDVIGNPTFRNFKFLVDVYPLKDKRWHFTAGFYWGPSQVAKAFNTTEDMPSLFSVNMYNSMYDKLNTGYYYYNDFIPGVGLDPDVIATLQNKFNSYGRMGIYIGDYAHDIYYQEDVYKEVTKWDDDDNEYIVKELVHAKGDIMHHKGDHYMVEPDDDCMVKAKMKTNSFKPYIGFGYGTDMTKSKSGWGVSFDAGLMFWGGVPDVVMHDGVNLTKDLTNVQGKVGRYVDVVKKFTVYPVVSVRVTKVIF